MSATMTAAGTLLPMAGEESHFPPTPADFWQPLFPMFSLGETTYYFTRPMALILISFIVLTVWLLVSTRRASVVPSKGQWFTERVYDFVRNDIARDMIGSRDFLRFTPLLFALFTFILLNNWFGIIPPFQNPTMARVAFPIALTLIVYVVYHWIGVQKHGLGGYFRFMIPPGLPSWLVPFIFLLELMTFFITRPLTLALRLFGNMFAGHMLLVVFIIGGWELLVHGGALSLVALPAWIMGAGLTVFEALIQFLQAYVFVLLAASYFGGALADEH
ncbi:F0F1 ATP synthase subunit A [Ornithinicoccus halotolerans]|uniref:F0F1 ATP synthase subunit A n=1 Tax=Ornithinicoccus halotolerans TaxID=1748220 RepID=UPI001E5979E4|nr:F0F1 ATP synthase subunit A [Ornithinicoccus halotolerans]